MSRKSVPGCFSRMIWKKHFFKETCCRCGAPDTEIQNEELEKRGKVKKRNKARAELEKREKDLLKAQ